MNKDKRESFKSLRLKHFDLLKEKDKAKDHPAPLIPKIKEQIEEWRQAGGYISEAGERDYLRSILGFWGSFVFEHSESKEYPETDLYPLDIKIAQGAKMERMLKRVVWPATAVAVVLIVLGLLAICCYVIFSRARRGAEQVAAAAQTATAAAMAQATAEVPTETPVPTFTPVPTDTPTVAATNTPVVPPPGTILVQISNLKDGDFVDYEQPLRGNYAGLEPGWKIYVVAQSLSSGLYFPQKDAFKVPVDQRDGSWQATAILGQEVSEVEEQFNIFPVVALDDAAAQVLSDVPPEGTMQLPAETEGIIKFPQILTVTRKPSLVVPGEKVVFHSDRDGNFEIYVMNSDGTSQTRLTTNSAHDRQAVWSPDGRRIAFMSERDGNREIYVMNADGSGIVRLTNDPVNDPAEDKQPAWSPDGLRIAFASDRDGNFEIYTMDATDGGNLVQLTHTQTDTINLTPTWSPDGGRIAFGRGVQGGNWDIYSMNTDGTGEKKLTDNPADDEMSSWSPDGSRIAFISERDENFEIYVMDADGSNQTRLTTNPAKDLAPRWSPDGKRIVFDSELAGNRELYAINADGSNQVRLTYSVGSDVEASWGLVGAQLPVEPSEKIVFHSDRDGNFEIYVMNLDGTGQTRLTTRWDVNDLDPVWSPDGKQIVFASESEGIVSIWAMDKHGGNLTKLVDNPWSDGLPRWSPDDKKLAFVSGRDGNMEIYAMDVDGGNQTRLTDNSTEDNGPAWSLPNGKRVAFFSDRDGDAEIYITEADGSNLVQLTNNSASDSWPAWSPDGRRIAFTSNDNPEDNMDIYVMGVEDRSITRLTDDPAVDGMPWWSADGSKIVFHSNRDGNWEIYIMDSDGQNQTRLTNSIGSDRFPNWSPVPLE